MTEIIWPSNTRDVINSIRGAIGRLVTFYLISASEPCTLCNRDPITNTSTDSFCPVCSGNFWIHTYSGVSISGHVTWGQAEQFNWATGGQFIDGDCRVQIENTVENITVLESAQWVSVDNRRMTVNKIIPRGVQDINRILIDLVEQEKED